MRPNPKFEVVPLQLRRQDISAFDAFHEDRVREDLARFADSPGLFEQYAQRARIRD